MRRVLLVLSAAMLFAGAAETPAVADAGRWQRAVDGIAAMGASGVQVHVHGPGGDWDGSAGVNEMSFLVPVLGGGRFRIGSITKTITATSLLQLVGDGRIGLDDGVAGWLPEFGIDPRITVRMILAQTSGLADYLNGGGGAPPLVGDTLGDIRRTWEPAEFVHWATDKPLQFTPGSGWAYSNTNYIVAGLLIEKASGLPYNANVYSRITMPLLMYGTSVPQTMEDILGPHAHAYYNYGGGPVDVTYQNPSYVWAAGGIVSSARDLDTFLGGLLGGRLLPPHLLAEMRAARPVNGSYGYGLGLYEYHLGNGCVGYGHEGYVNGYSSIAMRSADGSRGISMSVTGGGGHSAAVDRLVEDVMCG
ncbi:serine hydrolase domain-containing protein [Nocardia huaxiensis]|uniref:Beta-lactamase family protein n=1 Tax=Nocardia huaxiensis TaxID=2755382 RepID=A0A7D6Z5D8_9NOCA|nr:serine hydrolase domain-containing protein [Nocardia huaxiensis]QLY33386.1 beta-lactamase family protein [Nocardia huaxiensis]UFS99700.1 beta-lactamase family protein [Nocardia huaxiensis]